MVFLCIKSSSRFKVARNTKCGDNAGDTENHAVSILNHITLLLTGFIIVIPTPRVFMPIPAFAQSKACVSEPSLVGIAGLCFVIVVCCQIEVSVKG